MIKKQLTKKLTNQNGTVKFLEWKQVDKIDFERVMVKVKKDVTKFVSFKPDEGCWLQNDYSSNLGKEQDKLTKINLGKLDKSSNAIIENK